MSRSKRELAWVPPVIFSFLILPNIIFAVVTSNAEATTQTNGLLVLNKNLKIKKYIILII
jgi:hypothetical protein